MRSKKLGGLLWVGFLYQAGRCGSGAGGSCMSEWMSCIVTIDSGVG